MKYLFVIGFILLPLSSMAYGNGNYLCRSKTSQVAFHTEVWGSVAYGDHTVINGITSPLPKETQMHAEKVIFLNQNRMFVVDMPGNDERPFLFSLQRLRFGAAPEIIEYGICELIPFR